MLGAPHTKLQAHLAGQRTGPGTGPGTGPELTEVSDRR
jgi:hypothetical protein